MARRRARTVRRTRSPRYRRTRWVAYALVSLLLVAGLVNDNSAARGFAIIALIVLVVSK